MENQNQNIGKPRVDLSKTTPIDTWSGAPVWQKGYVLRQVSKFISGEDEDGMLPISVFFDPVDGRILTNTLPVEIRDQYETKDSLSNSEQPTLETDKPTTPPWESPSSNTPPQWNSKPPLSEEENKPSANQNPSENQPNTFPEWTKNIQWGN